MKTQEKVQPTPTPWRMTIDGSGIMGDVTTRIASLNISLNDMYKTEMIANAEFIVNAVNSHQALIDAAKYYRSLVDADLLDSLTRNGNRHEIAIAQAEGKS